MPQLWNFFLDAWTPVHFAFFFACGYAAERWGLPVATALKLALVGAVAWELVENLWIEPLLGFKEPLYNKWGTDILADLLGAYVGGEAARPIPSGRDERAGGPGAPEA